MQHIHTTIKDRELADNDNFEQALKDFGKEIIDNASELAKFKVTEACRVKKIKLDCMFEIVGDDEECNTATYKMYHEVWKSCYRDKPIEANEKGGIKV